MKENHGGLKFIVLHQFLLYTVGVIWKGDHSAINGNVEILLLARQEIILKLNIDTVEEHDGGNHNGIYIHMTQIYIK
jgi:hypothetical protein